MTYTAGSEVTVAQDRTPSSGVRIPGLDGLRGMAALFVVLHHCYLVSFPGYPRTTGPWWAGWMIYGHLAVVVFIVLSGFSLAVGPARRGWRIGSLRTYSHRRAWRILSAYWPALAFSLLMAWFVLPQPPGGSATLRSVVVYGLLVQDVTDAPSPNGAFWSIAVEAQLYLLLPIMFLIARKRGVAAMVFAVALPVLLIGLLSSSSDFVQLFVRFTPQLAVGFVAGAAAMGLAVHERWARLPFPALAATCAALPLAMIVVGGSQWTVAHYFWVDLAVTPSVAFLLAGFATGGAPRIARPLETPALRSLGGFSYSLYLVHAPIVVAIGELVVLPAVGHGPDAMALMLVLAVPVSLVVSRGFAALFDLPFQRHKSWSALGAAGRARLRTARQWTRLGAPRASSHAPAGHRGSITNPWE
jgi:peptidoglycan/LPS O-acetylase OafA/YrhL